MEKSKNPSHFPTIEEKYELTDSVLECVKNDYESGEYTVQQTADLWNLKLESIISRLLIDLDASATRTPLRNFPRHGAPMVETTCEILGASTWI